MKALEIQPLLNVLVDKVSRDDQFLVQVCNGLIGGDDFVHRLFDIYKQGSNQPIKQSITMGIHRSDYMLHNTTEQSLKQVELNTISAGLVSLSPLVQKLHKYLY